MVSVPTKGTHLLYGDAHVFGNAKVLFPSPRRGPIFSTQRANLISSHVKSFRPHEGDPSSLRMTANMMNMENIIVSVPTKGTHLLYWSLFFVHKSFYKVSVPTKGTHLLYLKKTLVKMVSQCMWFPSPRRGPIFSTVQVIHG